MKPPVPTVTYTNNLSNPVIFAEGTGITGLPTAESTGLRGGPVPYLVEPYLYNGATYYLQRTQNNWQDDWVNGHPAGEVVEVDWSDNIVRTTWSASSVIRVEVVLDKELTTPLNGYDMTYLFGEGIAEAWGTTGTKIPTSLPTVYTICGRLTIQKLDGLTYPSDGVKKPVPAEVIASWQSTPLYLTGPIEDLANLGLKYYITTKTNKWPTPTQFVLRFTPKF